MRRSRTPFAGLAALAALLLVAPVALAAAPAQGLRVLQHQAVKDLRAAPSGRPESLEVYGRRFELELERNERLAFVTRERLPGVEALRGQLRGLPGSWVRMTVTRAGLYGMFSDGADIYVVEPAHELVARAVSPLAARGSQPVVYRLADTVLPPGEASCGTVTLAAVAGGGTSGQQQFDGLVAELQSAFGTAGATASRQLEVAVVGDYEFSQLGFSGGLTPAEAIAARMNVVDGIFASQVGVRLVVPHVTLFSTPDDPFSGTLVPGTLLQELGVWRQNTPAQAAAGLTHLFTGRDLDGSTVGIAYLRSLCRARFGSSLSQAVGLGATTSALVVAHEIGHNFGAVHDGESGSACESTPQTFLMAPRIVNSDRFSQCSLDTLALEAGRAACIVPLALADADLDLPPPARQPRGIAFDYGFAVRSIGERQVDGVSVTVTLPVALRFESGSVQAGGACSASSQQVSCAVGSLAPGARREVTLRLTGLQAGSATAGFALTAANDAVAANNGGSAVFNLDPSADLAVSLGASPTSFTAGGSAQVSATVRHLDGDAVGDARLALTVPAGLSVTSVSANALGCALAAGAVNCSAVPLSAGATETVTLTVTGSEAGLRTLQAGVSSVVHDPAGGNNAAQAQVEVRAPTAGGSAGGGSGSGSGGGASSGGGGGGALGAGGLLALLFAAGARRRRGDARVV